MSDEEEFIEQDLTEDDDVPGEDVPENPAEHDEEGA